MAGYNGYSMSNNAVSAYENGEKPFSKWKKTEIIEAIERAMEEGELSLGCSLNKLKKMPTKCLKLLCLHCSSWHHTGKYYNRTVFYSLDLKVFEELTDKMIDEYIAVHESRKAAAQVVPKEERWKCAFLEWSGTRKHPKAIEDQGVHERKMG